VNSFTTCRKIILWHLKWWVMIILWHVLRHVLRQCLWIELLDFRIGLTKQSLYIVLLRLLKSALEPWFFSNIEPYQNCGFMLSIDGFSICARKQLLLSARLSHCNSVCLSICLSVTRVDQSKTVQATITESSPLAAWKTLVSGTVKLFHKFERGHPKWGP